MRKSENFHSTPIFSKIPHDKKSEAFSPAHYTNPISFGHSWYQDSISARPKYPALHESITCDVAIIGGGFTGLAAANHLASAGLNIVLIDAACFGDGASGRNGGQIGTGHRQDVLTLEKHYGFEKTKTLFDLSEEAKQDIMEFLPKAFCPIDYKEGQLSVTHKMREVKDCQQLIEAMQRYDYHHLSFINQAETIEHLGSKFYCAGVRDTATGHINPLKYTISLAHAAKNSGAKLYENSCARKLYQQAGKCVVETINGNITANKVLIATNGYALGLNHLVQKKIIPICSYIGATAPLPDDSPILKYGESVADSRFVVRYFRKSLDNRLLFGGVESYDGKVPNSLESRIRAQIGEIYPELKNTALTHYWGGTLGLTVERMPYVQEVMNNVTYCGGYSGHGVLIAHFLGKLYAQALLGQEDRLQIFKDLKISNFAGNPLIRKPLLMLALRWFALMDRI